MTGTNDSQLDALVRGLDLRSRVPALFRVGARVLTVALAAALALTVADIALFLELPLVQLVALIVGAGLVTTLLIVAIRPARPTRLLIEADRAYNTHSLLVSGYQFADDSQTTGEDEAAFRRTVVERANAFVANVDPAVVYPLRVPRQSGSAAALAVALLIAVVLNVSGWFDRPVAPMAEQGLELEDAGRRLAERAADNEVLQDLARQMQDLGDRLAQNQIDPDQARERIEELSGEIEEQIRSIERTRPFERNDEAVVPPESEETIRRALQRGMGQEEVRDFFTRMRSEGNTVPDMVEALEEATPDRAPDTNLGLEEEQVQELMDQLNRPPPAEDAESDIVNELEESRRIVQQTGEGLAEVTEGEDGPIGQRGESGVSAGGDTEQEEEPPAQDGEQSDSGAAGQQGGDMAVEDATGDDFQRVEDASPVFRELDGIVTENTMLDVIIRELPSEATSELSEQERDAAFEQVIEEAISREETPLELQRLVRNYFLRVTRVAEEEQNEQ